MQNYRAQAEEITLKAFWSLDVAVREKVFEDKSQKLRYFKKNAEAIQQNGQKVPKKHLKLLLENVFDVLPAHTKCELLCLELYDLLETSRKKITQSQTFTVDEAFDLYSEYLSFVYKLHTQTSKWFGILVYEHLDDWLEVAETVKFITTTRLRASALHFRKDLEIIADNSEKISAKIVYAVDFLGIKVAIQNTNYSLDRLYAFDEFPIPAVVGKFAEALRTSIFEALNDTQYQLAIQEMQDGLLAHDFGIALEHYRGSKPLFNKVDFSFSLKGGAGSVSMNIKTWASLGKRILAPFRVKRDVSKTSPAIGIAVGTFFALLGAGIVWWAKFADKLKDFMPLVVLGAIPVLILFLLVMLFLNRAEFKIVEVDGERFWVSRSDRTYTLKNIEFAPLTTYEYILQDRRQEIMALQQSEDVHENMYGKVWAELRKVVRKNMGDNNHKQNTGQPSFFEILSFYQTAFDFITQQPETDDACLPVIRYILLKRLKKSIEHFDALDKFANEHQITPKLYIALFDVETQLDIEAYSCYTSPTVHNLYQILDEKAIFPIVEEEALHAFMVGKLQALQDDAFSDDLEEVKEELKYVSSFLLEGEEIVARVGNHV